MTNYNMDVAIFLPFPHSRLQDGRVAWSKCLAFKQALLIVKEEWVLRCHIYDLQNFIKKSCFWLLRASWFFKKHYLNFLTHKLYNFLYRSMTAFNQNIISVFESFSTQPTRKNKDIGSFSYTDYMTSHFILKLSILF